MASLQTAAFGTFDSAVRASLADLDQQRAMARVWEQDASVWSQDASVQATIRTRLGWLAIHRVMAQRVPELRAVAAEVRAAGLTHAVLLGMGGSGLFAEVCRNTIGRAPDGIDLTVLDTTDPSAIRAASQRSPLANLCAIVSSKSGSTSEISALSKYFYHTFAGQSKTPGSQCLVVTDTGTSLEQQGAAWKARRVFTHGPGTGAEVGGRLSALTYFGLVPAALMGIDVAKLLQRAEEMFARCGPASGSANPAAELAAFLGAGAREGRNFLTLCSHPALASFSVWAEQLIAESTGKQGQGITPICHEPPLAQDQYGRNRIFIELQLANSPDREVEQRCRQLQQQGHPVLRIAWDDPYDVGGEFAKWCLTTALVGALMRINPFDEPNVKESKDRTKALLERYAVAHRLEDDAPGADDLSGLEPWLRMRKPNDAVVLLSFLPRTPSLDERVLKLRASIAARLGCPTAAGFGPRYLHSTGQLYKGGPDVGLFLLLTSDEREDLAIPEEPFTFGVLKHAQAVGDFQAMQQRGRRILRIHFRDPAQGLARLESSLKQAMHSDIMAR